MRKPTEMFSRNSWIGHSLVLMLLSLFLSRAALSVSMMLFFSLTILHKNTRRQVLAYLKDKFLLMFSLLFWIPFISGLWSADLMQWQQVAINKLPFLLFPLAFAGSWTLPEKKWHQLSWIFLLLVVAGCGWSLLQYFLDPHSFHEAYRQAKLITTPLENDHVRFSWMVAVANVLAILLWQHQNRFRLLLAVIVIFFTAYLHLLAARMGLSCFYLFIFFFLVWKLKSIKLLYRFLILTAFFLLPLIAWIALPTFQKRFEYFRYDITQAWHGHYAPGTNDGARLLSLRAGWQLLQEHPVGVGAGDVVAYTEEWFNRNAPQVIKADRFPPMNEWLMYGGFAGWPGLLLFTVAILFPFFLRLPRHRFFWWLLNGFMVFSYLFDMALEVQYGVFLYSFILLWWYKWFKPE